MSAWTYCQPAARSHVSRPLAERSRVAAAATEHRIPELKQQQTRSAAFVSEAQVKQEWKALKSRMPMTPV